MVFTTLGNLLVSLGVLAALGFKPALQGRGVALALLSGLVGGAGLVVFLYALSKGRASVIVPLTALYPLLTVLLSVAFLREPVSLKQGVGIVFAMIAVLLISL